MHILIATPYYRPDISGAANYLADFAAAAIADGHAVTVLHLGRYEPATVIDGVHVLPVTSTVSGMTSVRALQAGLRIHRRQPTDLIVAGMIYPTGVMTALLSTLTRVPHLAIVMSEELATPEASALPRLGVRFTVRRSRNVIAISHWSKRNLTRLTRRDDVIVLHPSLDASDYVAASDAGNIREARVRLGLEDRQIVLTVARLEARKGHDMVLRAIARLTGELDNVHYLIVGEGDQQVLRDLSAELGVEDRVTFLSRLDRAQLLDVYSAADVFAMTSRPGEIGQVEGFGIVYLEAAACGVPAVAGNLGGCADAVVHDHTGLLVDPTDVDQIASALGSLLTDPVRTRRFGQAGQRRVADEFDFDSFANTVRTTLAASANHQP